MGFNLEKYLVENNLTLISRVREANADEITEDSPSDADISRSEKQLGGIYGLAKRREKLTAEKNALLDQYKNGTLSKDDYIKQVAPIFRELKKIEAKINPKLDSDEDSNY